MRKFSTGAAAIGLSLCVATATAMAQRGGTFGGGGGVPHVGGGGGGVPHVGGGGFGGGGVPHFGGGGTVPHFGGGVPHVGGGMPHVGGVPHFNGAVTRFNGGAARFTAHGMPHTFAHGVPHTFAHGNFGHTRIAAPTSHIGRSTLHAAGQGLNVHGPLAGHAFTPGVTHAGTIGRQFAHAGTFGGPRTFAAHRMFAANGGTFHPFWGHGWHLHHHLGWIGPVFWPYAYGDFFYYTLWPDYYAYYDPLWVYGYPDIYEGIFSPYDYAEYVQGPGAPARMKRLTESMAQSCAEETDEVTGWPIDQISAAVQPDQQQAALLDDLGNAVVKASDTIRSNCPTTVSFTPTGRLDAMDQRLQGLTQAVDIINPPLTKFYDSLSDEQKARFNAIKPPAEQHATSEGQSGNAASAAPKSECDASAMAWPTEQIDRTVRPTDAQRVKLDALQAAVDHGTDLIKAACPSEIPSTPPARLAAAGAHLKAMLQAVEAIRQPLHDFYNSLSDDQKARFNTMGRQLFAANK